MLNPARLTPDGKVTIPRSILKSLGITGGSTVLIELEDDRLVLRKVDENGEEYPGCGYINLG